MTSFVDISLENTPDVLVQQIYDKIQTRFPGWQPSESNLETWMIAAFVEAVNDTRDLAADVPDEIFKQWGSVVMGLPPIAAAASSANATFTAIDNAGYTISAGMQVGVAKTGDDIVAFQVVDDVAIPPASTSTAAGEVLLEAVVEGTDANGLTGSAEMIDAVDFVDTATLTTTTSGGTDAELDEDYLNRLTADLQTLAPRPIIPRDYEILALNTAGISRAKAVDGYDLDTSTTGNERMITLIVSDAEGLAVSSGVKTDLKNDLESKREINFVVFVGDPTYTSIDVLAEVQLYEGFAAADGQAAVEAALADYFSPMNWGRSNLGELTGWVNTPIVRYTELVAAINQVSSVNYIVNLEFSVHSGVLATTDIALTGAAPLTTPGDFSITADEA